MHLTNRWESSKSRMVSEVSSLLSAGTVGTPIWAALAKVLKPRQLLSTALLLQAMKQGESDRIGFKKITDLFEHVAAVAQSFGSLVFESASLSPILGRKKMPFWMLGVMA